MRLTKVFGLTVIAAIAAMALLGASSATAMNTALCSSNESGALTCAAANQFKTIHAVAKGVVFLTPEGPITCEESLLSLTLLGLAAPQVGHVTSLTWKGCTNGAVVCTVTTTSLGTELFLKTAVNLAIGQFHNMELSFKCNIFFECKYGGLPTLHVVGASLLDDNTGNGGIKSDGSGLTSTSPLDFCPGEIVPDLFWGALSPVYVKT